MFSLTRRSLLQLAALVPIAGLLEKPVVRLFGAFVPSSASGGLLSTVSRLMGADWFSVEQRLSSPGTKTSYLLSSNRSPFDGGQPAIAVHANAAGIWLSRESAGNGSCSFVLPFRLSDLTGSTTLIDAPSFTIALHPEGRVVRVQVDSTPGEQGFLTSGVVDNIFEWHLIQCSYDAGGSLLVMLDGKLIARRRLPKTHKSTHRLYELGHSYGPAWADVLLGPVGYFSRAVSLPEMRLMWLLRQSARERTRVLFGTMSNLLDLEAEFSHRIVASRRLSGRVNRMGVNWGKLQSGRGMEIDFAYMDKVLDALQDSGQEPLLNLTGTAIWSVEGRGVQGTISDTTIPTGAYFSDWLRDYQEFVQQLVDRYGSSGERPRVRLWELWNEPNLAQFWNAGGSGTVNPAEYALWFSAIQTTILKSDPAAQVSMAGLATLNYAPVAGMSGADFLKQVASTGARPRAIAIHLYSGDPSLGPKTRAPFTQSFSDYWNLSATTDRIAVQTGLQLWRTAPIWITEFGWNLDYVSEARQAEFVGSALRILSLFGGPRLKLVTFHLDSDINSVRYGLFDSSVVPYRARRAAGVFANYVRKTARVTV